MSGCSFGSARLGSAHRLLSLCVWFGSARLGSQTLQKLYRFSRLLLVCMLSAAVPPPPSPPPLLLLPVPLDPHNPVQLGVTRHSTVTAAAVQPAPCSGEQLQPRSAACILQQAAGSAPSRPDGTLSEGGDRSGAESVHRSRLLLIYGRSTWLYPRTDF